MNYLSKTAKTIMKLTLAVLMISLLGSAIVFDSTALREQTETLRLLRDSRTTSSDSGISVEHLVASIAASTVYGAMLPQDFQESEQFLKPEAPEEVPSVTTPPVSEVTQHLEVEEVIFFPSSEEEEYIWRLFATTMYFEAAPDASWEGIAAIGWVIQNRMADPIWNETTYEGHIYRDNPTQFSVTLLDEFEPMVDNILVEAQTNKKAALCLEVAQELMQGSERGRIPADVQFFYGDPDKRTWGSHTYYATIDGNSFFYK